MGWLSSLFAVLSRLTISPGIDPIEHLSRAAA
jgi:hypothetical protein